MEAVQQPDPAPSLATRALGVLGILGGALLLAAWIPNIPWGDNGFMLRLIPFNIGAIAIIIAVHLRQATISRRLSLAASVPAVLANGWYLSMVVLSIGRPVFPEPDPDFRIVFTYAALALWISDAFFGSVALRIGAVTRWGALALTTGALLAALGDGRLGFTSGPFASVVVPLTLSGVFLVGIGWIWLGVDVATRRRRPEIQQP